MSSLTMLDRLIQASPFLQSVETFLQAEVAPLADQLDADDHRLLSVLKGLGEQGWLTLRIPIEQGGRGVDDATYFVYQALLARYSGAVAFLQTQHQSAAGFIQSGRNTELQTAYLPPMATGQRLVGIGFSHLRRATAPLQATPVPDGYRISGVAPWVTGSQLFEAFVGAAVLPSGEAVFGLFPLQDSRQPHGGQLTVGDPMPLSAMGATNTVQVALDQWCLPMHQVIDVKPAGWIQQSDRKNVLKSACFALGCAQAGVDAIAQVTHAKQWQALTPLYTALQQEIDTCFAACLEPLANPTLTEAAVAHRRDLRGWAVGLMGRCVQGAIAATGGAANAPGHSVQRLYREAVVFTVTGQTPEMTAAILGQLVS